MEYTVLIQPQRRGFTAMIPTLPECHARGKTEQEAVNKVRERAQQLLAKSRLMTITLPENGQNKEDDPWLAMADMWRDDPTWDEYQRLIKKYRKRP
jgi:predicted RNase H-like HicB family nuclease